LALSSAITTDESLKLRLNLCGKTYVCWRTWADVFAVPMERSFWVKPECEPFQGALCWQRRHEGEAPWTRIRISPAAACLPARPAPSPQVDLLERQKRNRVPRRRANLPPYVAWKNPEHVIVHTATTIETRRSAYGTSIITPADRLYIRNNLPAPDVSIVANRDAWILTVEGVRQPRAPVAELKSIGLETVAMVLQCSGNGRYGITAKLQKLDVP
jgi:hypothetical protein